MLEAKAFPHQRDASHRFWRIWQVLIWKPTQSREWVKSAFVWACWVMVIGLVGRCRAEILEMRQFFIDKELGPILPSLYVLDSHNRANALTNNNPNV